jgi:hypothetical protein
LSIERDWLLVCQAASSACFSVGGWLDVWANALEASKASPSVLTIAPRASAQFLGRKKLNKQILRSQSNFGEPLRIARSVELLAL